MSQIAEQVSVSSSQAEPRRVLIVENDPQSLRALEDGLAEAGFAATALRRGEDALASLDQCRPHLVMLDWEHPSVSAARLIHYVQRDAPTQRARLMALSQYSSEQMILSVFELGVDDYVVRPYSLPVLLARVRAVLRRLRPDTPAQQVLEFHRLRMDLNDLRIMVDDQLVHLRPTEFRLLELLMRHPERVFSREQILNSLWTANARVDMRAVDVNVQRARKALSHHGCGYYLQTVRSFGYRLSAVAP
jgi:two-component system phosphate regulon response regulator PhoB